MLLNPLELDPDRDRIMVLFKHRCLRCHRVAVTVHEIEPKSHGHRRAMAFENRIPLCHACHEWIHKYNTVENREMLKRLREETLKKYANE